jgi:hypothetical protein
MIAMKWKAIRISSSFGSKREVDESENLDNPSCGGCYY